MFDHFMFDQQTHIIGRVSKSIAHSLKGSREVGGGGRRAADRKARSGGSAAAARAARANRICGRAREAILYVTY